MPVDREGLREDLAYSAIEARFGPGGAIVFDIPEEATDHQRAALTARADEARRVADFALAGPLAPILAQADTAAQAVAERDEADRRAGAAERRYENERDTTMRRDRWLREAKERAGYHDNISFDTVWAETLAKAESLSAAQAEVARLSAEVEALRAKNDDLRSRLREAIKLLAGVWERGIAGPFKDKVHEFLCLAMTDAVLARTAEAADRTGDAPADPTPQKDRDHG